MKRIWPVLLTVFPAVTLFATSSFAQDPLSYQLTLAHEAVEPAILRIKANENLKNCRVDLHHCTQQNKKAKNQTMRFPSIARGETKEYSWTQPAGNYQCRIQYRCELPDRNAEDYFEGEATHTMQSVDPLHFDINMREMSRDISSLNYQSNRAIKKAQIEVTAMDGTQIDKKEEKISPPSTMGQLSWNESDKKPARIQVTLHDELGAWSSQDLFYFQIPHTDIVFDTNKSTIRSDQEQFLHETAQKVVEIVETHDRVAMDLYIAGYTDTVGSAQSNLKLSRSRAKSIAQWFRRHGIKLDIYYQGFGEQVLAVPTPDETDEEKNRRAVYLLTNTKPQSDAFPNVVWLKL